MKTIKIADIKRNAKQPRRTIREADLNILVESIKRYGIVCPVIVAPDNTVVEGQTRLIAAARAGITELEVGKEIVIRDVDPAIYSQVAHTRVDPSEMDRATWLRDRIQERISADGGRNPLQLAKHIEDYQYKRIKVLDIPDAQLKEYRLITYAIVPGDDISAREAVRLLKMLDWPEDMKDEIKKGELAKSTIEEVAPIKQKEMRQAVIKEAKDREWGNKKVRDASIAVRTVDTPKERDQVMKALKGGVEPESVRRVTEIKETKIRGKALDDLEKVAKSSKGAETYVVEVAHEKAAGIKQPIDVRISNPESRYVMKLGELYIKITEEVNGLRISEMTNEKLQKDAIAKVRMMIKRLEAELEKIEGKKMVVES